jgi:hypothetical protein
MEIAVTLFERLHRILRWADLHFDEISLNTGGLGSREKTIPVNFSLTKF